MQRVVIESPLSGDFARNKRYALWCAYHCRTLGQSAYASHLFFPQFLDDEDPDSRTFGIEAGYAWAQTADVIAFYIDLGMSGGMLKAEQHWANHYAPCDYRKLPAEMFAQFEAGEVPKTTRSF